MEAGVSEGAVTEEVPEPVKEPKPTPNGVAAPNGASRTREKEKVANGNAQARPVSV